MNRFEFATAQRIVFGRGVVSELEGLCAGFGSRVLLVTGSDPNRFPLLPLAKHFAVSGEPTVVETLGRHDPCVGIRATPIAEALLALVVMDHALRHRAQCGDVSLPVPPISGQTSPA